MGAMYQPPLPPSAQDLLSCEKGHVGYRTCPAVRPTAVLTPVSLPRKCAILRHQRSTWLLVPDPGYPLGPLPSTTLPRLVLSSPPPTLPTDKGRRSTNSINKRP